MIRNARFIVALSIMTGVSLAGVIAWATGIWTSASNRVESMWGGLTAWIQSPFTDENLLASIGVVAVPLIILLFIFAIVDG